MAPTVLHLRSETKALEHRSALTPSTTKQLVDAGYTVNVEKSPIRIFDDAEFEASGAALVPEGSWSDAPEDHIILGLKELPETDTFPLKHTHVQFAHCYKGQGGWEDVLARFPRGGGTLLDLEFLSENGRRVAAFGYHAGFAGAAMALDAWSWQLLHGAEARLPGVKPYGHEEDLLTHIKKCVSDGEAKAGAKPRALVIGALGRCGRGAVDLLEKAGLPSENIIKWDLAETSAKSGPYLEIAEADIFVNCIYLSAKIPPFIDVDLLSKPERKLSVVCDVSCDTTNPHNPIPIYTINTTFSNPTVPVSLPSNPPLSVISIDHLPSLLPREASEAFSKDLLPYLLQLKDRKSAPVWQGAEKLFHEASIGISDEAKLAISRPRHVAIVRYAETGKMSMFSFGYGNDIGGVGDRQMDQMDQMDGDDAQNLLSAHDHSGDGDLVMADLAADMLPFDLDLNAIPDSTSQDVSSNVPTSGEREESGETETNLSNEKKDTSGDIVIGAGPLPTGFGVQLPPGQGSTLTEFTKRRNWSQRIIEELKDFLHVLSPDGRLAYVSPSAKSLTGYDSQDLLGKIISEFIHPDDSHVFIREFNESIATGNPLRFFYRFRKADGSYVILECHGHPHLAAETATHGSNNSSGLCRGFFMMARRYPTKNSALLDSFLEHKVENERLRKRIAELKREEQEDMEGQKQNWPVRPSINSTSVSDSPNPFGARTNSGDLSAAPTPSDYNGMPPPAKPTTSNAALTQQNLDEALASSRPDSIKDKMARYEGATHIETIEMLTGLRYRDGERSKGISTGDQSPTLVRGDAGIPIQVDKNGRPTQSGRAYSNSPYGEHGDKKKKLKVADEYVCTDCGTLDSPEWRKGPSGPKTLCNACGLRWAKKEKKRTGRRSESGNGNGGSSASASMMGPPSSALGGLGNAQSLSANNSQSQMQTTSQNNMSGAQLLAPSTDLTPILPARMSP